MLYGSVRTPVGVCLLDALVRLPFVITLFRCPMKAVRNFESPLTLVMIANAKLAALPRRKTR